MKFTFVILVLMLGSFLAFFARAHDADPRLIGTWRSNRALTAETIRPHLKGTPEKQDRFLSVFGLMRLTYTADTITAFMPALGSQPDWTHSTKYRVTASAPDSVTIQPHDWPIGDNKPMVIHFVSPDRYWTEIATPKLVTTGWREFFERVPN